MGERVPSFVAPKYRHLLSLSPTLPLSISGKATMSAATHQLLLALDYGGTKHTAALLIPGERAWLAHDRVYVPPGADWRLDQAAMLGLARGCL